MTTMTLTAKSYAELEPFETLAKQYGVQVKITEGPTIESAYGILKGMGITSDIERDETDRI